MSVYRFCRTDDIPLLVEAFNACWVPHFGAEQALTVESFKRDVRSLNLWASSSMLAIVDDEPVGVLLGAKRDDANLVHRIALKPGHERRGHGGHLLESLCQKVAILGPPRLLAEIPAAWDGARRFFERCGFRAVARYTDFALDAAPASGGGLATLVSEVSLDDLLGAGALDRAAGRSWQRAQRTLENRRSELMGLAIASYEKFEAYVLGRCVAGSWEILALGEAQAGLLRPLVAGLYERFGEPLRIPGIGEDEIAPEALAALGFRAAGETIGYAAEIKGS